MQAHVTDNQKELCPKDFPMEKKQLLIVRNHLYVCAYYL